jgi:predicted molibdopterin-dependent oxidoreductase YjgC
MSGGMSRIIEHPILGSFSKGDPVEFTFDGRVLRGFDGEPVAAALKASGVLIHRYTAKLRRPRGIFCAIGRCTDCVMIVDGKPNIRTCVTPLSAGMDVRTQHGAGAKDETV